MSSVTNDSFEKFSLNFSNLSITGFLNCLRSKHPLFFYQCIALAFLYLGRLLFQVFF